MEHIIMSRKEREQVKIFEQIRAKMITQREAAQRLKMSPRWINEKYKRYKVLNDAGIIHGLRGKISRNRWNKTEEMHLIELLENEWHGFGPTFAAEKLKELFGFSVSKETVRKSMIRSGHWEPGKKKFKHRERRERKLAFGMMVQLDGSPHDWFEGRADKCTLLVFIDDATSRILWLEFAIGESLEALMQATKNYIEKYGIPGSLYTDHGSVFHVNLNNQENEKKTHWAKSVESLGIKLIHANSPQAKGRVERCNKTMQDRLIKELRLSKISSIETANEFLKVSSFIAHHNNKFASKPKLDGDTHRSSESYDLNRVFSIKEDRILANDYTISYKSQILQLSKNQKTAIFPKNKIAVYIDLKGQVILSIRNIKLNYNAIESRLSLQFKEKTKCFKMPELSLRPWKNSVAVIFPERVG